MLMNYFEVFLALAVVVCAVVGFLGPVVWRREALSSGTDGPETVSPTPLEPTTPVKPFKGWREFFWMLLAVLCLRAFIVEPFKVPSGSMIPTLLIGDYLLVNKHAYGLKLPVTNHILWQGDHPQRGDIVVFTPPHTGREFWVKRVIGVPGDRVRYFDDQLYVNDSVVPNASTQTYRDAGTTWDGDQQAIERIGEKEHFILQHPSGNDPRSYGGWVIPEGQYFVMGDNRNNSLDSRYWGTVPERNIRGRVDRVFLNSNKRSDFRWWTDPNARPVDTQDVNPTNTNGAPGA